MEERIVVARSEVPVSCSLGNLIFERRYQEAIDSGLKLLEKDPEDCMIHINLMDAYFKGRALSPDYFDKSTYYAKQAILYGHNTGYAEDRLAKNLEKLKLYHQSLQLYDLILENKEFHFSQAGIGNKIDFARRRELAKKKWIRHWTLLVTSFLLLKKLLRLSKVSRIKMQEKRLRK